MRSQADIKEKPVRTEAYSMMFSTACRSHHHPVVECIENPCEHPTIHNQLRCCQGRHDHRRSRRLVLPFAQGSHSAHRAVSEQRIHRTCGKHFSYPEPYSELPHSARNVHCHSWTCTSILDLFLCCWLDGFCCCVRKGSGTCAAGILLALSCFWGPGISAAALL